MSRDPLDSAGSLCAQVRDEIPLLAGGDGFIGWAEGERAGREHESPRGPRASGEAAVVWGVVRLPDLEQHLEECADCRQELEAYRGAVSALRNVHERAERQLGSPRAPSGGEGDAIDAFDPDSCDPDAFDPDSFDRGSIELPIDLWPGIAAAIAEVDAAPALHSLRGDSNEGEALVAAAGSDGAAASPGGEGSDGPLSDRPISIGAVRRDARASAGAPAQAASASADAASSTNPASDPGAGGEVRGPGWMRAITTTLAAAFLVALGVGIGERMNEQAGLQHAGDASSHEDGVLTAAHGPSIDVLAPVPPSAESDSAAKTLHPDYLALGLVPPVEVLGARRLYVSREAGAESFTDRKSPNRGSTDRGSTDVGPTSPGQAPEPRYYQKEYTPVSTMMLFRF